MAERDSFLRRWSQQKAAARGNLPAEPHEQDPPAAEPEETVDLSTLPDIDDLDLDSNFSLFMQPGVPDELRTRALRKLWTLDPAFSELDGLVEYGEDFAAKFRTEQIVRTAWRLGKGMPDLTPDDTEEEDTGAEETVAEASVDDPPDSEASTDSEKTS